jgi:hypothetical protein
LYYLNNFFKLNANNIIKVIQVQEVPRMGKLQRFRIQGKKKPNKTHTPNERNTLNKLKGLSTINSNLNPLVQDHRSK